MAAYESTMILRGIEVNVFADEFEGDESTGVPYGPTCIWAEFENGDEYTLSEAEELRIAEAAIDYMQDDDYYPGEWV